MGSLDLVKVWQVNSPEMLTRYICQQTGTPHATLKDSMIMRKKCKQFFEMYPHCDYVTLCHVADWCKRRKKRFSNVWKVIDTFRWAYEDGAIPEMDRRAQRDPEVEAAIEKALEVETDTKWRTYLIATENLRAREDALEDWLTMRKPMLVAS